MFKWPSPFPFAASFITIISIAILCSLGSWQLQRLNWKNDLVDQIQIQKQQNPLRLEADKSLDLKLENPFLYSEIQGSFVENQQPILWQGQIVDGQSGFYVLGFFELSDSKTTKIIIPVVLGSSKSIEELKNITKNIKNKKNQNLVGWIRSPDFNIFTPQNINNSKDNYHSFYRYDDEFRIFLTKTLPQNIILTDYVFLPDRALTNLDKVDFSPKLNNNHLQYAFFWFSLALILALVFVVRFMYHKRDDKFI